MRRRVLDIRYYIMKIIKFKAKIMDYDGRMNINKDD